MRISDWSSDGCSSDLIDENQTDASMISLDPPEHAAYRRMVTPGFVPKRISGMEERIRARVTRLLDGLAERGKDGATVERSEERRVGKEGVSTGRSRWSRKD